MKIFLSHITRQFQSQWIQKLRHVRLLLASPQFSWLYRCDWFHCGYHSSKHCPHSKAGRGQSPWLVSFCQNTGNFPSDPRQSYFSILRARVAPCACHWNVKVINTIGLIESTFNIYSRMREDCSWLKTQERKGGLLQTSGEYAGICQRKEGVRKTLGQPTT